MNENSTGAVTAGPKRQTGVGLSELTMQRVDRLRAVQGASRTRVIEDLMVTHALNAAELAYENEIKRFNRLAARDGVSWQEYADWYAATFSSKTFPPGIAELEERAAAAGRS